MNKVTFDEGGLGYIYCYADGSYFLGYITPEGGFKQNKNWGDSIPPEYMRPIAEKILSLTGKRVEQTYTKPDDDRFLYDADVSF